MVNLDTIKNTIKTSARSIMSSKLKSALAALIVIIIICLCIYAAYKQTDMFSSFNSSDDSVDTGDRPVSSLAAKINSIEMKHAQWLSKYAAEKNASINRSQPGPMFAEDDGSY